MKVIKFLSGCVFGFAGALGVLSAPMFFITGSNMGPVEVSTLGWILSVGSLLFGSSLIVWSLSDD